MLPMESLYPVDLFIWDFLDAIKGTLFTLDILQACQVSNTARVIYTFVPFLTLTHKGNVEEQDLTHS